MEPSWSRISDIIRPGDREKNNQHYVEPSRVSRSGVLVYRSKELSHREARWSGVDLACFDDWMPVVGGSVWMLHDLVPVL